MPFEQQPPSGQPRRSRLVRGGSIRPRPAVPAQPAPPPPKQESPRPQPKPQPKKQPVPPPPRLPDGSSFVASYDAAREQWTGTITVGDKTLSGTATGVFKLLQQLERQFRESEPPTTTASN